MNTSLNLHRKHLKNNNLKGKDIKYYNHPYVYLTFNQNIKVKRKYIRKNEMNFIKLTFP